jgi:uncharacterized protein
MENATPPSPDDPAPPTPRDRHLFGPGPKRILALDGGGVRGVLSLAILERIEKVLASRSPDPAAFRLADYFDLIGGTSTGSLIATGLALGLSVAEMLAHYQNLAGEVFRKQVWNIGLFGPKFPRAAFERVLIEILGDTTLGAATLRTGLAIAAKRMDTDSAWILHNNPRSRYFDPPRDDPKAFPNRNILLRQAVLASTAAPTYFEPEFVQVTEVELGAFVDGGVSPYNNPALLLLMMASTKGYAYNWALGSDRLMLISVGTGIVRQRRRIEGLRRRASALLAVDALTSIIGDCNAQAQAILQWMSSSPTARQINAEIGDLSADHLPGGNLLSYFRYDAQLEINWLAEHAGFDFTEAELAALHQMDRPRNMELLLAIGRAIATRQVDEAHLAPAFDLPPPQPGPDGMKPTGQGTI